MSIRKLIVEADGGSRGNPGAAGYGALVKDAITGQVLAETAEAIGRATNNVAEYKGLIAGLAAAQRIAPGASVEVRMDSKLVVEQMSGRWQIKHPDMRPLAEEARRLAGDLGAVRYTWIPRAQNSHADRLANEAMDAAARGESWEPREEEPEKASVAVPAWTAPTSQPTTTLLLRHGETPFSGEKRFAGIGDIPLTETGVVQAKAAARALAGWGIEAIVASPLRRCQDTAAEVAAVTGLEVRTEDGFRETDFGDWEGLTFAQAREGWPDGMDGWLSDWTVAPPGGESFADTARRVRTALDKLKVRHRHQTVLVVSHVTPIKTLVRYALEAPPLALYRMHLDVASLSSIDWYDDGPAVLKFLNDTHHHT
ncbi:MAG: Phosphoglycerate mutase [Actinomycetia bacterium]|nr:Phosphoglycerate mutase [Actinomycetes bacterium]